MRKLASKKTFSCSKARLRIIGEDTTLSIKVGGKAADSTSQDVIVVRGVSADVDTAVKGILKIVEDAKNDEIVNSHVS